MVNLHPILKIVDVSLFSEPTGYLTALYGLPKRTTFCKECVISNQRSNSPQEFKHGRESIKTTIVFDDGVCN